MKKKTITILASLLPAVLLSACMGVGVKESRQTLGAKFEGEHSALARCVVNELQSDSRWLIRALQYDIRMYPDIAATEVHAYAPSAMPGIYPRNSPDNPDAVISHGPPKPKVQAYKQDGGADKPHPGYSFVLMLKRSDPETVVATLSGEAYESNAAWQKLKACSVR